LIKKPTLLGTTRSIKKSSEQAGYGELSSSFIFLQRVLAALQSSCDKRDSLISDISAEANLAFEETWEVVKQRMNSAKPKNTRQFTKTRSYQQRFDDLAMHVSQTES
jgi:hypothetical protein